MSRNGKFGLYNRADGRFVKSFSVGKEAYIELTEAPDEAKRYESAPGANTAATRIHERLKVFTHVQELPPRVAPPAVAAQPVVKAQAPVKAKQFKPNPNLMMPGCSYGNPLQSAIEGHWRRGLIDTVLLNEPK